MDVHTFKIMFFFIFNMEISELERNQFVSL